MKISSIVIKVLFAGLIIFGLFYVYSIQEPSWHESYANGTHLVVEMESIGDAQVDEANTERARIIIDKRFEALGIKKRERIVKVIGDRKIAIQFPTEDFSHDQMVFSLSSAHLEFKSVSDDPALLKQALEGKVPPGLELKYIDNEDPVLVRKEAAMDGSSIKDARTDFDSYNSPYISIAFDAAGTAKFAEITKANVGTRLAIIIDGKVISAPTIQEAILGGAAQITGQFTAEEAMTLALTLRSGALPAPIRLVERRKLTRELWQGKK